MKTEHNHISAVLLAGGAARRMGGGDKCLLELAGSPMLAWVLERVENQVRSIVINANGDPKRFALFGRPVTPDPVTGQPGPLAGILAGMRWAAKNAPKTTHIVSLPTDAPFLPLDLVERLNAASSQSETEIILVSSNGQTHPVFGLWPIHLADDLEKAIDDGVRKVMQWVETHPTKIVDYPNIHIGEHDVDPFFNTNTPENMREARVILEDMLIL